MAHIHESGPHGHPSPKSMAQDKLGIASSLGLGFLLALSITNISHFIQEAETVFPAWILAALALLGAGAIGWGLAKHLSTCTHEHRDDPADAAFVALVVIGSLIHTVLDGLVIHEAFAEGIQSGAIILFSIIFHEAIRTTVLFKVLRIMGFRKIFSGLIVFGISAAGIAGGFLASGALEVLHEQEALVELVSGAIFFIVAVDLFFFVRHHHKKTSIWWLVGGILLFAVMNLITGGHGHE